MPEKRFLVLDGNNKREAEGGEYPFGLERRYVEATNTISSTSNTYQTALTLNTGELAGGNYKIDFMALIQTNNANGNRRIEIEITVDGNQILEIADNSSANTFSRAPKFGQKVVALSQGSHTIEMRYRRGDGGSVFIHERNISLERWN